MTTDPIARAHEITRRLADLDGERDRLSVERDRLVVQLRQRHALTVRDLAELVDPSAARVQQLVTRHQRLTVAPDLDDRAAVRGRDIDSEREAHFLRVEQATNGAMLNAAGRRKGIDPRDILTTSSLLRYASEELLGVLTNDPPPRHHDRHARAARAAIHTRSIA